MLTLAELRDRVQQTLQELGIPSDPRSTARFCYLINALVWDDQATFLRSQVLPQQFVNLDTLLAFTADAFAEEITLLAQERARLLQLYDETAGPLVTDEARVEGFLAGGREKLPANSPAWRLARPGSTPRPRDNSTIGSDTVRAVT
jgi:hypothetical protein